MIKMTRVYGDMYVPREYCTFTNPVTSGGTEEVDYVDMPCENGCEKECENCTLQKIMNEYARLTRQDIDENSNLPGQEPGRKKHSSHKDGADIGGRHHGG